MIYKKRFPWCKQNKEKCSLGFLSKYIKPHRKYYYLRYGIVE